MNSSPPETDTPAIEIETGSPATASVIWLHGLGADGHDFEPIIPELRLPAELAIRFIFPHAPYRPVTLNNGQVMRAWYDMTLSADNVSGNFEHMGQAEVIVQGLISKEQQRGIPADRIVLAGFSQGGAVALHTALRYPEPLAGVLALSTYVPHPEVLPETLRPIPVFMAHGSDDPLLPVQIAEASRALLTERGLAVQWQTYVMGHGVCPQELDHISEWLQARLARDKDGK